MLFFVSDLLSPNARNKLNQQQRSYKLFAGEFILAYSMGSNKLLALMV